MKLGIQGWIHKLEEAEGPRYMKLAAAILGLLALAALYDLREYKNFQTPEGMDTAQLARNIAQGNGYSTQFIRPLSLFLVSQRRNGDMLLGAPHPDLANPPVYPLLLAGLMKILPFEFKIPQGGMFVRYQPEVLIAFFNQALFLLAVWMVFQLAKRLFDVPVAWVSAAIFAGTDLFWRFSVSGQSTILLTVIFLALVWCLLALIQSPSEDAAGDNPGPQAEVQVALPLAAPDSGATSIPLAKGLRLAILSGALVGLGMLTRYSFGWLILPLLAFIWLYSGVHRWRFCLGAGLVFAVVVAPWLYRNYSWSGNCFGIAGYAILQEGNRFPGTRLERSLNPDFRNLELEHYFRKLLVNTDDTFQNELPRLGRSWIAAFFVVSLFISFRSLYLHRMRVFLLLCLGLLVAVQALGRTHLSADSPEINSDNLLVFIAPMTFIYGVGLFFVLLDQLNLPLPQARFWLTTGFGLIACAPLIFALLPPKSFPIIYPPPPGKPGYYPPLIQQTAGWLEPNELMMSDVPWAVAWYGNRGCLWNTLSVEKDFYAIHDWHKPIRALYLTQLTVDAHLHSQMIKNPEWAWGKFFLDSKLRDRLPSGFPLKYAPGDFLADQLFLSDRVRW